jgi:hypothetical protein
MKTVAASAGKVHPGARALIEAAQDFLAGTRLDWDTLQPITPAELAARVTEPAARTQIVHGMVTVSLVDEVPPQTQTETIRAFANALGVKDGMLETVDKLVAGHMNQFRFCFLRRAHLKNFAESQLADAGVLGTARAVATTLGLTEDRKLAARYAALGELPAGSLGRELHRYYLRNAFPWPGQKLAAPEAIVSHDVTHVVSGYDTDPVGETLVAAFTSGYQQDPGLFFTPLIGLVMFSTGVHVIPNPNVPAMHVDAFSKPDVARRWFRAIERGGKVNLDLSKRFDLWSVAREPVEALRERWNIEQE